MGSQLADQLFFPGMEESKKYELIYRLGPLLSAGDLAETVARLRADCRYARLLGALIDISKSVQLAREELSSGNAISPKIVSQSRWLYTCSCPNALIEESFVREILPSLSSSCQEQILNKISKWLNNTELGDKLWAILRVRSDRLSSMISGACSNDLLMREIEGGNWCLTLAQMLDILRKRFDSGIELLHRIVKIGKMSDSPINKEELYRFIVKRNWKKGIELMSSAKMKMRFGRRLSRALLRSISIDESHWKTLLSLVDNFDQKSLARYTSGEKYLECFFARFSDKFFFKYNSDLALKWLNHLPDGEKLQALKACHRNVFGKALTDDIRYLDSTFLFLLDDEIVEKKVTQEIADEIKYKSKWSLHQWQALLLHDEESFATQKERLKGEDCELVRKAVFWDILRSVFVLRRPQYLAKRLRFLIKKTRKDSKAQATLIEVLWNHMEDNYVFFMNEEIWQLVEQLIDIQLSLNNENIPESYEDILLFGLKKVRLDQQTILLKIMEQLNKVLVLRARSDWNIEILPEMKKIVFLESALTYRESLRETIEVANGGLCPEHLQNFYLVLARECKYTESLIANYPQTFEILKLIVSSKMSSSNFPHLNSHDVHSIYHFLAPHLPNDFIPLESLFARIKEHHEKTSRNEILKNFRKSKIATEEIRALYFEMCHDKRFVKLCGRSIPHVRTEEFDKWVHMLKKHIEENPRSPHISHSFDLLAMISFPEQLKSEAATLCREVQSLNSTGIETDDLVMRGRMHWIESLRHFNESESAFRLTLNFMKGNYLRHALRSFNFHLSRLPFAKMIEQLQEHVTNTTTTDPDVRPVETHPTTLQEIRTTIDERSPAHVEYLMKKLFGSDLCEDSGGPTRDYAAKVLRRITGRVKNLSLHYLFAMLEQMKSQHVRWTKSITVTGVADIIVNCVPKHAEALKNHLTTFGRTDLTDARNSMALAREVSERSISGKIENPDEIIDLLCVIFESRTPKDFRELRLLGLTKNILPFIAESQDDTDLRTKFRIVTRSAIRTTAGFLENYGKEYQAILEENVRFTLKAAFTFSAANDLSKDYLDVFHSGMTSMETIIFLSLSSMFPLQGNDWKKLQELFWDSDDDKVRIVARHILIDHVT